MNKFKVGDRVVVVRHRDSGTSMFLGCRGKVSEIIPGTDLNILVHTDKYGEFRFAPVELDHEETYQSLCAQPVEKRPEDDPVNHPSHYTSHPSGVECKDIIGHYPFFIGSAIKYLWRAGLKTDNPIEDLRKAIKCIEFEIERLGGGV